MWSRISTGVPGGQDSPQPAASRWSARSPSTLLRARLDAVDDRGDAPALVEVSAAEKKTSNLMVVDLDPPDSPRASPHARRGEAGQVGDGDISAGVVPSDSTVGSHPEPSTSATSCFSMPVSARRLAAASWATEAGLVTATN